jgi:hypothetical protein
MRQRRRSDDDTLVIDRRGARFRVICPRPVVVDEDFIGRVVVRVVCGEGRNGNSRGIARRYTVISRTADAIGTCSPARCSQRVLDEEALKLLRRVSTIVVATAVDALGRPHFGHLSPAQPRAEHEEGREDR